MCTVIWNFVHLYIWDFVQFSEVMSISDGLFFTSSLKRSAVWCMCNHWCMHTTTLVHVRSSETCIMFQETHWVPTGGF